MKFLIDTDFLVGVFRDKDPHHHVASKHIDHLLTQGEQLYISNLVLQETGTVLSHRTGMNAVRLFYQKYPKLGLLVVPIDSGLEQKSWELFLKQTKKGTSFTDCANLVVIKTYKLDGILSFDRFYPRELMA